MKNKLNQKLFLIYQFIISNFILLVSISPFISNAQQPYVDTSKKYIEKMKVLSDGYTDEGKFDSAVFVQLSIFSNPSFPANARVKSGLRICDIYRMAGSSIMLESYIDKTRALAHSYHQQNLDYLFEGGLCYLKANQFDNEKKYDSSVFYAIKGIPFVLQFRTSSLTSILYEIKARGLYSLNHKNIGIALSCLDSAILHIDKVEFPGHYYNVLLNKANILANDGKYKAALALFIEVFNNKEIQTQPTEMLWAVQGITNCYEGLKDYKQALYYSKKVSDYTEKVFSPQQLEGFKRTELAFKEKENKDLATINSQSEALVKNQRNQLILAFAALVFLSISAFYLYHNRKQLNKQKQFAETQGKNLQQLDEINKKIFATISHDLNSPLITLESLFELMGLHEGEKSNNLFFQDVRQQLSSCNQVLQNLLQWSKVELGQEISNYNQVDLSILTEELLEQMAYMIKPKQLKINFKNYIKDSIYVPQDVFKIASRNLLSNAIKFSPIGGIIEIELKKETNCILVSFINIGQFPQSVMDKLFKGVATTTKGSNYETGYGLGLYITAQLMEKNHGKITAQNNQDNTCTVTLQFIDNVINSSIR